MAGSESSPKLWICPESPATGGQRTPTLVAAAERAWPYVVRNCEAILRDDPAACEIMERSVSALERRKASAKIEDLPRFLRASQFERYA